MNLMVIVHEILTWRALLDIFLLTAGLFFLYRTLLRLGTWKIVTGIMVAVGVLMIASLLDLKGITWVYRNISHVALIAVIVIFQPELRKVFERAALLRRSKATDPGKELARMIAGSIWKLASQHQGAILVIPGREPIEEWLSGGYPLNGTPSDPLISSVFDPHSPGHDGAMIVENGRLTKFGVRLPVSQGTRLGEAYGTRHHAAMGLAEKSDALVIVASEERGQVSVFHNGRIKSVSTVNELVATISDHWQETLSFPFRIKGDRWQTVAQVVISLTVALFLWSTQVFTQSERLEKIISAPVEYTVTAKDLMLVGDRPNELRLHISGPRSDLDTLSLEQLRVKVDLAKVVAGKQSFVITEENLNLPRTVRLLDVNPSILELTLAAIVREILPIKPQLVGQLASGLEILSIEVNPAETAALIPVSEGQDMVTHVTTTPIYLTNLRDDTKVFCKVVVPPTVQLIDKRWPDVEVLIKLSKKETKK